MARIGVAVIGAGFMGGVHTEALRRAGCDVVGVLGVSDAESQKFAAAAGVPKAYGSLAELLDDPAAAVGPHRHPEQAPLRDGQGRSRGRQARAVREAARHDLEGDGRARGPRRKAPEAGRRRQLQHPLLPAEPRGPRAGARRASSAGSTTCPAATCRTGCSSTPTTTGACSPTRAESCGRWPTSGPTGWTSSTRSPGSRSRPCAPTSSPSTPSAAGRRARSRRSAASSARKPISSPWPSPPRTTGPSSSASRAGRAAPSWCRR